MREARKPLASVRATAIHMLARREHSRAELSRRLVARGGDLQEIEGVLDALEREGYLSDARFAQTLVARKAERFGKRAIASAMRARGVDADAAKEALRTLADADEWVRARSAWARRFKAPASDERARARQVRFLLARGYALSVALKVVAGGDSNADSLSAPDPNASDD
ncbi:MAG TPA: regulatory protein RecX [Casimicrobiaceae bacterium]|nr:regulatory protein RecX [Casimicrobiaceae bacterium]